MIRKKEKVLILFLLFVSSLSNKVGLGLEFESKESFSLKFGENERQKFKNNMENNNEFKNRNKEDSEKQKELKLSNKEYSKNKNTKYTNVNSQNEKLNTKNKKISSLISHFNSMSNENKFNNHEVTKNYRSYNTNKNVFLQKNIREESKQEVKNNFNMNKKTNVENKLQEIEIKKNSRKPIVIKAINEVKVQENTKIFKKIEGSEENPRYIEILPFLERNEEKGLTDKQEIKKENDIGKANKNPFSNKRNNLVVKKHVKPAHISLLSRINERRKRDVQSLIEIPKIRTKWVYDVKEYQHLVLKHIDPDTEGLSQTDEARLVSVYLKLEDDNNSYPAKNFKHFYNTTEVSYDQAHFELEIERIMMKEIERLTKDDATLEEKQEAFQRLEDQRFWQEFHPEKCMESQYVRVQTALNFLAFLESKRDLEQLSFDLKNHLCPEAKTYLSQENIKKVFAKLHQNYADEVEVISEIQFLEKKAERILCKARKKIIKSNIKHEQIQMERHIQYFIDNPVKPKVEETYFQRLEAEYNKEKELLERRIHLTQNSEEYKENEAKAFFTNERIVKLIRKVEDLNIAKEHVSKEALILDH